MRPDSSQWGVLALGTSIAALIATASNTACAASLTINKANNADNLNLASSWTGGVVPGALDTASWSSTVAAANSTLLGADLAWRGIEVLSPGGAVSIGAGNTLSLGGNGIDLSNATQDLTISSNLTLATGGQAWNVATGRILTLNTGSFTRTAGTALNLPGAGTVAASMTGIANTNAILGPWATTGSGGDTRYAALASGNLLPFTTATAAAAFGWTSGNNNTFNYDVAATQGNLGVGRQANTARYTGGTATQNWGNVNTTTITLNGLMNSGTGILTFSEAGGTSQGLLAIGTNNGNELVLGAANADLVVKIPIINTGANAGSLLITGPGTVTIDSAGGASTYTGTTTVASGTLLTSGVGSINTSSALTIRGASAKYLHTGTVASTVPITLTRGTLDGTGTVGAVSVGNGTDGILTHGNGGTGTFTMGSLSFGGAAAVNATLSGSAAPLAVSGALSTTPANGLVALNVTAPSWANGVNNVISYGSLAGSAADFTPGTITGLNSRQSVGGVTVNGNNIALTIVGDSPKWTGARNDGRWTTTTLAAPKNWRLISAGTTTDFLTGDNLLFDDSATGTTTLDISDTDVAAGIMEVNNSSKAYRITSPAGFGITAGSLIKNGTGSLSIESVNAYAGGTTFNAGTLNLNSDTALGTGAFTIAAGSAKTLDNTSGGPIVSFTNNAQNWNDDFIFAGSNDLDMGIGAVTAAGAGTDRTITVNAGSFLSGELKAAAHGLIKQGTGLLGLSSAGAGAAGSTLGGALNVAAGTLRFNWTGASGASSGDFTATGLTGSGTIQNGATDERWLFINTAAANTFNGTLENGGTGGLGFNKQGAGSVILAGTLSYTGATTVEGGTLTIPVTNSGAGTNATVNSGTLVLAHPSALGTTSIIRLAGNNVSTLNIATDGGDNAYGFVFGTTTNATVVSNRATEGAGINHTLTTVGIGGVGGGTITFTSGANVSSGTGRITFTQLGMSAGSVQATVLNPTTANVSVGDVSKVANAPAQTLELGGTTTDNQVTGVISNGTATVTVTKSNSSTWTLSNTNTYTGNTNVGTANGAGVLRATANGALGSGTIFFDASGGNPGPTARLELSNNITLANPISMNQRNNVSAHIVNSSDNNTMSGNFDVNVGGSQALIQSDAGLLTLSGAITTTAATTRHLHLGGAGNGVVSGVISSNATTPAATINLIKDGAGTWTFSGVNTYTGSTTVNAGTLAITGDSPAATGLISVTSAATLGGNGDVGGTVAISGGAHHALAVAATPGEQVTRSIGGVLDLSGVGDILDLTAVAAPAAGSYVLVSASGGITGHTSGILDDTVVNLSGLSGSVAVVGNDLVLTVSGGSVASYEDWASSFGLNPSVGDGIPTADKDSDSYLNGSEYILGGSPASGSNNPKIYSLIADSSADGDATKELVMTIAVPQGTPTFPAGAPTSTAVFNGFTITVRGSGDLGGFPVSVTPVAPVTSGLPAAPVQGGVSYEYRSFSLAGSNGTVGKGFLQVVVLSP